MLDHLRERIRAKARKQREIRLAKTLHHITSHHVVIVRRGDRTLFLLDDAVRCAQADLRERSRICHLTPDELRREIIIDAVAYTNEILRGFDSQVARAVSYGNAEAAVTP